MKALGEFASLMFVSCWYTFHWLRRHKITMEYPETEKVPVYVCSCGKSILTMVPDVKANYENRSEHG